MKLLSALNGINGEPEIQRVLGAFGTEALFKPRPKLSVADFVDSALLHPQNPSDIRCWDIQFPDRYNLLLGQPSPRDAIAPEMRPMNALIVVVFLNSRPAKIARAIIERVAIVVGDLMPWRRLRPMKRRAYQLMDGMVVHSSVQASERHLGVFHPSAAAAMFKNMPDLRSTSRVAARGVSTNIPKVRNAVVRVVLDCKPSFFKVFGVSHSAVPLRGGQGRALLKQCFRPVFSSRITICSQGATA